MVGRTGAALVMAVMVAGCSSSLTPPTCSNGSCGSQTTVTKTFQQSYNRMVDVLFVVDDTETIAPWAENIAAAYPAMAQAIERMLGDAPNVHVGFVRASRRAVPTRDCGTPPSESFLRRERCGSISNFSGGFVDAFTCLADLGAQASPPGQPFQAARDVFAQPPPAGWDGFLRREAALLVVFIAGRDDASAMSAADLAAVLHAQKDYPEKVLVSAVVPGDCPDGEPTPRFTELAQLFGGGGQISRTCDNPADALSPIFGWIQGIIVPPCLRSLLDVDPAAPGVQVDCTFQETSLSPGGVTTTTALASCDTSAPPCWRLIEGPDPTCTAFQIDRGAGWCVETPTSTRVECLAAASGATP